MEPVSVSFLLTREDYIAFRLAEDEVCRHDGAAQRFARPCGAALLAAAFLLLAFCQDGAVPLLCGMMAVCGIVLLFLLEPLAKSVVRGKAAQDFDEGMRIPSQTVNFLPDRIEIRSERYRADLPYEMLCRAYENRKMFLLFTGIGECRCVPKRAMNEESREKVSGLLKECLKSKFIQEGAPLNGSN